MIELFSFTSLRGKEGVFKGKVYIMECTVLHSNLIKLSLLLFAYQEP